MNKFVYPHVFYFRNRRLLRFSDGEMAYKEFGIQRTNEGLYSIWRLGDREHSIIKLSLISALIFCDQYRCSSPNSRENMFLREYFLDKYGKKISWINY